MVSIIESAFCVVSMLACAYMLITGKLSGGQFLGAALVGIGVLMAVDFVSEKIKERRDRHESPADAGTKEADH